MNAKHATRTPSHLPHNLRENPRQERLPPERVMATWIHIKAEEFPLGAEQRGGVVDIPFKIPFVRPYLQICGRAILSASLVKPCAAVPPQRGRLRDGSRHEVGVPHTGEQGKQPSHALPHNNHRRIAPIPQQAQRPLDEGTPSIRVAGVIELSLLGATGFDKHRMDRHRHFLQGADQWILIHPGLPVKNNQPRSRRNIIHRFPGPGGEFCPIHRAHNLSFLNPLRIPRQNRPVSVPPTRHSQPRIT